MRIVIACAGSQAKWNNHLGVPSHLVPDRDGEPILHRTVRQCNERGFRPVVVSPLDDRYTVEGADVRMLSETHPTEFHSAADQLSPIGMNLLILGDTWFTNRAMDTLFTTAATDPYFRAYGRRDRSYITGSPWGELFAYSWNGVYTDRVMRTADDVVEAHNKGILRRKTGWEVIYLWQGVDFSQVRHGLLPHTTNPPVFVNIDDASDDIDFEADYYRHPMFGGNA